MIQHVEESFGDWRDELVDAVKSRAEECHGGCGDKATRAVTRGKRVGGWCGGCWSEVAYGRVPRLDPPKGTRRPGKTRRALMDEPNGSTR